MRYLILLLSALTYSYALIDGIAIKVNNTPITLYEIQSLQKEKKISKKEAEEALILKAIKSQEIKRLQIEAEDIAIDKQIQEAATMKGISRDEYVSNMVGEGYSYEELRAFYRDEIQEQLLTQRILSTNLKIVDEKEIKRYFQDHQKEFTMPQEVIMIQYAAQSERALAQAINNPFRQSPSVSKREERISLSGINPQIAQMFAQTKKGEFTQTINNGGAYLAFYIKDKIGSVVMPFDQIKPLIMQKVILSRKEQILKEYFDRLIASAIIVKIRD